MIYLTGFADEAADDIDGQIRAIQTLGWSHIELRSVDQTNIVDLPNIHSIMRWLLGLCIAWLGCFLSLLKSFGQLGDCQLQSFDFSGLIDNDFVERFVVLLQMSECYFNVDQTIGIVGLGSHG